MDIWRGYLICIEYAVTTVLKSPIRSVFYDLLQFMCNIPCLLFSFFSRGFVRTTYALMPTQGLLWKSQFRLISSSPYTGYESSYYSVSTSSLVTTDWLEMTTTMLKAWNLLPSSINAQ